MTSLALSSPGLSLDTSRFARFLRTSSGPSRHIGSFLDVRDVASLQSSGKEWKVLVLPVWDRAHLSHIFHYRTGHIAKMFRFLHIEGASTINLKIIGPAEWIRCFDLEALDLNLEASPILDKRRLIEKVSHLASSTKVEDERGFTALLIPNRLTLSKLAIIAAPLIIDIDEKIKSEIEGRTVTESHWVLLSNSILEGSRWNDVKGQKELVASKGAKVPSILSIATLIIMSSKLFTNDLPFSPRPRKDGVMENTFTRSFEMIFPYSVSARRYNGYDPRPEGALPYTRPITVGATRLEALQIMPNRILKDEIHSLEAGPIVSYTFRSNEIGVGACWEV